MFEEPRNQRVYGRYRQWSRNQDPDTAEWRYCGVNTTLGIKELLLNGDETASAGVLMKLFEGEFLLRGSGLSHEISFRGQPNWSGSKEVPVFEL